MNEYNTSSHGNTIMSKYSMNMSKDKKAVAQTRSHIYIYTCQKPYI